MGKKITERKEMINHIQDIYTTYTFGTVNKHNFICKMVRHRTETRENYHIRLFVHKN